MCKLLLNSPRAWVYSTPAVASQLVVVVVMGPCCGSGLWGVGVGIKQWGCVLGVKENPITATPCHVGAGRGALPACRAAPQPLVPTGGPRPPPNPPDPLQELVGGLQVSPGWAPHTHTQTLTHTRTRHRLLSRVFNKRAQSAAASSPRVQKLGGGIAFCIALRAGAAPRCRPPCRGVASYKTKTISA